MNAKRTAKAAAAPAHQVTCEALMAGSAKEHLYFALLPIELRTYVDLLIASKRVVFRLLLTGDASTGKTSLVHRFTRGTFNNDCPPTTKFPSAETRTLHLQKKAKVRITSSSVRVTLLVAVEAYPR